MRFFCYSLIVILSAPTALAQTYYAEQTYPSPTMYPPQVSGNVYAGQPTYVPQYPQGNVPSAQVQQPTVAANAPRRGEYGTSVMTDIRQMNF